MQGGNVMTTKRKRGASGAVAKKKRKPKPPGPPKVRAKSGAARLTRKEKLETGGRYVAAQKTSSIGPAVAKQAKAVETQCAVVTFKDGERRDLALALSQKVGEVNVEEATLATQLDTYARDG